jgi:hypothetical protein
MRLPAQPWLKIVFIATAVVFASVALDLFALQYFAWAESDAAVPVLLAAKVLDTGRPVVDTWYYANGDVWILAPHLLALLPVAVLGIGPASLLFSVVVGFVLELIVLVREYARLCGERWIAVFAAMVTLMAWSQNHVMFVYIQLSYGFVAVVYVILFGLFARLAEPSPARPWLWAATVGLLAALAVQSPIRVLVFGIAPLLAACAWPWHGLSGRRRLGIGVAVVATWGAAHAVYTLLLARIVEFSVPHGHLEFRFAGLRGIRANVAELAHGVLLLCAGGGRLLWALPGLVVMLGAVALVVAEALASRTLTRLRFFCVVVAAQLAVVCLPLVIGNLLVQADSVRYVLPSVLTMIGLAAILAVRATTAARPGWQRRLAVGWLVALPVAALIAVIDVRPPPPSRATTPDLAELARVADALVERKLTHGFSAPSHGSNVLNLQGRGATLACPVYFHEVIVPQRWLADTRCYAADAIPERFYVVYDRGEEVTILPPPVERFHVGPTYEVAVFASASTDMRWLDLPMVDGDDARFPMEIAATHLQMRRSQSVVEGGAVVATGTPGTVIFGPYIALPRGDYELVWIGRGLDTPGEIAFTVHAAGGANVFAKQQAPAGGLPRAPGELARLAFRLKRTRDGVEFLVRSSGGARVELHRLVLYRR